MLQHAFWLYKNRSWICSRSCEIWALTKRERKKVPRIAADDGRLHTQGVGRCIYLNKASKLVPVAPVHGFFYNRSKRKACALLRMIFCFAVKRKALWSNIYTSLIFWRLNIVLEFHSRRNVCHASYRLLLICNGDLDRGTAPPRESSV